MDLFRKLRLHFLILWFCIFLSLKNTNAECKNRRLSIFRWPSLTNSSSTFSGNLSSQPVCLSVKKETNMMMDTGGSPRSLEYGFYRESCPKAEQIVREVVERLFQERPEVAPAVLRLVFHDCFIQGCDASVLLDPSEEIDSEKDSPPNETLKGFDIIDTVKSEVEKVCPGVVSCADILVLAARDCVALAGGPFYPLHTGRRDSTVSFRDLAANELPSPQDNLPQTLASFESRGFNERETASLFGAHSIGVIHCKFFENRLYNFSGTDEPDPSLDVEFLHLMRSRCNNSHSISASAQKHPFYGLVSSTTAPSQFNKDSQQSSTEEARIVMDYEGPRSTFGTLYYRSLLQGKGILYADQQLMAREETWNWARAYAFDAYLFHRDFSMAMMKLSDLQVLTAPMGQIRLNCSKVV